MEPAGAFGFDGGEAGAKGRVGGGSLEQTVEQGADIEPGAAADDRQASADGDFGDEGAGAAGKFTGGEDFVGLQEVEEVVGDTLAFARGDFGGADIQALIELQRIAVNDFALEGMGEMNGEVTFAGSRWTDNEK